MFRNNLFNSQWCDQIFDGRNKEYGAYFLRKNQARNSGLAMFATFVALGLMLFSLTSARPAKDGLSEELEKNHKLQDTIKITEVILDPVTRKEDLKTEETKGPKGNENTTPKVVADNKVTKQDSFVAAVAPVTPGRKDGDSTIKTAVTLITHHEGGNPPGKVEIPTVTIASQMPEYPGGDEAMNRFLISHLDYSSQAIRQDIEGKVYVQFVINTEGKVTNAKVVRGLGYGLDENALASIQAMPNWSPGNQNGHPVNVQMVIPLKYQLNMK